MAHFSIQQETSRFKIIKLSDEKKNNSRKTKVENLQLQ